MIRRKLMEAERPSISIEKWYKYVTLSGAVHTRVEVHGIDSEVSRLVERPWLQLMCCAICLPHGCNFR